MNFKALPAFVALLALMAGAFASTTVVVNSQLWEDVMAGSVFAASNGYGYMFVLTPSHGDYLAQVLSATAYGDIKYYEGANTVSSDLGSKLSALGNRVSTSKQDSLAAYFALQAPKTQAIIVGKEIGAEALSIAPYAALTKSALWFADGASADSTLATAKGTYSSVLVYGSIADKMSSTSGAKVVNTGSIYGDNLEAMKMFFTAKKGPKVMLLSGNSFEKSMVGIEVPVMLLAPSGASSAQLSFLKANSVKEALVFEGDSDISDAVVSLKKQAGISVFAKLGEGYPTDAQMRDLAVAVLPSKTPSTLVVVNSESWQDKLAGAAYAESNGYSYSFLLTEAHATYFATSLNGMTTSAVMYFEGAKPVSPDFSSKLSGVGSRLSIVKNADLASYFALQAPKTQAIIVGKEIGAEALSIAPYAALTKSALWFADGASADSTLATAKGTYSSVLVYGSIADKMSSTSGAKVVNTGSIYGDNLEAMKMFFTTDGAGTLKRVAIVSGKTFERSMVSSKYPTLLSGATRVLPASTDYLKQQAVTSGVVFQTDGDITQAVSGLKADTGMAIFAKLGEGYTGDVVMRDLAVVPLPVKKVELEQSGLVYDYASKSFQVDIRNKGASDAYVTVSLELPSGLSASSGMATVGSMKTVKISVPINAEKYVDGSAIKEATCKTLFGADKQVQDTVSSVKYTGIRVTGKSAPVQPAPSQPAAPSPAAPQPAPQGGIDPIILVIAILVVIGGGYFLMSGSSSGKKK